MNSKFMYVEKRIQISQLYRNVLQQQCNLEENTENTKNALALAIGFPDIFAYLMQGFEYMLLLTGEVIHIKCVPVKIKLARTSECYDQLSVIQNIFLNSANLHLAPKDYLQRTDTCISS